MLKFLTIAAAILLVVHGLIHLMGVAAYMRLTEVKGVPYKTTLLGGRWDLGERGIAIFGALWLVPATGFVFAAVALLARWQWWQPVLAFTALFSLVLTGLDWSVAFAGAIVNIAIVAAVSSWPLLAGRFWRM